LHSLDEFVDGLNKPRIIVITRLDQMPIRAIRECLEGADVLDLIENVVDIREIFFQFYVVLAGIDDPRVPPAEQIIGVPVAAASKILGEI